MHFPDFAQRVSHNVRAARERAALTQEELAQRGRLSYRHYQRLEAGGHVPTLDLLFRIACVLSTTVAALVDIPADEWATADLPEQLPRQRRRRVRGTRKNNQS